LIAAAPPTDAAGPALRVCADPNNLPYSNDRREGFENKIAAIVGGALGRPIDYFWLPQRRAFVRSTLGSGECDLIIGVPAGYERVATTRPYYRSSYVFVQRAEAAPPLRSFDDARLAKMTVGIQITGEDYENPPPAQALAFRHLVDRVRGFTVYGDYSRHDPQRAIIDAVANGQVDTAAVWGPLGGYYATREPVRLRVTPISPTVDRTGLPFAFSIAMGVKHGNTPLLQQVDRALASRRSEITAVLRSFGVPLLPLDASGAKGRAQ
jgi:quinoprotein dehydrogenase-associated probable ABC transporter substrate-binding protein